MSLSTEKYIEKMKADYAALEKLCQQQHEALVLCEHKVDQHLQGQYHNGNKALGVALASSRAGLLAYGKIFPAKTGGSNG